MIESVNGGATAGKDGGERPWVVTVSVGVVTNRSWRGRIERSAIGNAPLDGPVAVGPLGLAGDEQADRKNHGGPDKAVLAYSAEHYAAWRADGLDFEAPAFGENLTTVGLTETTVVLGSVYQVGGTVLQAASPRRPCYKLAAFHDVVDLTVRTQRLGRVGVYFRVLEPGTVRAGDEFELLSRPGHGISAAEVHRVLNLDRGDLAGTRRLLEHPEALPDHWVEMLRGRLAGFEEDASPRLLG